jgi:hypothetical protein
MALSTLISSLGGRQKKRPKPKVNKGKRSKGEAEGCVLLDTSYEVDLQEALAFRTVAY